MKSIVQFLGFVSIGLLGGHILRLGADWLDPPETWWHVEKSRIREASAGHALDRVSVLGVGNSHAGAFDYSAMQVNGLTINRAGGDSREMQMSLEYWTSRAPNVSTVLYAASFFIFDFDNGVTKVNRNNRIIYYTNNPIWRPITGDEKNFALGKLQLIFPHLHIVRPDAWEAPIRALISGALAADSTDSDTESEMDSGSTASNGQACPMLTRDELAAMSSRRVASHASITTAQEESLVNDQFAVLSETSTSMTSRDMRLIFVTPPYHITYNAEFLRVMPEVVHEMRARMDDLADELAVEYYDFSDDPRWSPNDHFFSDSDHLNACGAESFSKVLAASLELSTVR